MMTFNTSGPGLGALSVRDAPMFGAPVFGAPMFDASLSDAQITALATQAVRDALLGADLVALFKLYGKNTQGKLAAAMIAAGGSTDDVTWALLAARNKGFTVPKYAWAWGLLSTVSGVISGYHGYKRNDSVGWAIGWFFLGSFFPIITPVISVAQGYAKPKRRRTSR